jgi:hypothetical protein
VLADEGLAAALEDLAQDSDGLVRLECTGDLQVSTEVARAAYAVVAAALSGGGSRSAPLDAYVDVDRVNGHVRVSAQVHAVPEESGDDADIADRVGALGGAYERTWRSATETVTAVIPCES